MAMEFGINTKVQTDKAGYEFLSKLYTEIGSQSHSEHIIDFSRCSYFDANLAAAVGAILDSRVSEGYSFMIRISRGSSIYKTLSRNGFLNTWLTDLNAEEKENYIKYKRFDPTNSEEFKRYIDDELLHKQKFPKHTERAGQKIQESIYEIYANAVTHGASKYVHSCGEYDIAHHTLDMTIVDCGRTIPTNVNNYMQEKGRETFSSVDAVRWAVLEGNTTKSIPGGLGLYIITDFIKQNEGVLQIVSGDALLEYNKEGHRAEFLQYAFPGTIINMRFNFDDKKNYFLMSELNTKLNKKDLL